MTGKLRDRIRMIISGTGGGKGRPTKETMLIIFLSGILIFVILLPTGSSGGSAVSKKNQKRAESTDAAVSAQTGEDAKSGAFLEEYRRNLERELEEFLSSVAGVGEVKVLIYMKNSQEYIVEKDIPTSNSVNGESSELRKDEATVYTTNEDGNEVPFVTDRKSVV